MSQDLTRDELETLFGSVGDDVRVHRSVVVFGGKQIDIGSHVRIDAFAILSAGPSRIAIGHHVHVAAGVYIYGGGGHVCLDPFVSLSARSVIYTASDNFSYGALIGPMVPDYFRSVDRGAVVLYRGSAVGAGSVVMPGVTIGESAAVGALSLVKHNVSARDIVAGCPARKIGERVRGVDSIEQEISIEREMVS